MIACNTSSALALPHLIAPIPLVGTIWPTVNAMAHTYKKIGVIATVGTAKSQAFEHAFAQKNPALKVCTVPCPLLVPIVEANQTNTSQTKQIVQEYLTPLIAQDIEALIYGCTHYPFLSNVVEASLPSSIVTIDPADYIIREVHDTLKKHQMLNEMKTTYYASGLDIFKDDSNVTITGTS